MKISTDDHDRLPHGHTEVKVMAQYLVKKAGGVSIRSVYRMSNGAVWLHETREGELLSAGEEQGAEAEG